MTAIKVGVIGAGAWGTAMSMFQAQQGNTVTIWAYETETVQAINEAHCNKTFLPDHALPYNVHASADLIGTVREHEVLIMATPSHVTRSIIQQIRDVVTENHRFVILTKGIEQSTAQLMHEVYEDTLGEGPTIAVLSGPNFAKEVASGLPTAAVLACRDVQIGKELQQLLSGPAYRIYLSQDIVGVQIGGTVKNVVAIATGICDGMGLGLNARAALICRGLAEIKRLGVLMGGQSETFLGMSGVGDLVLTATGSLSRNYTLGKALGKGETLEEYMANKKSVAEGVKNAVSVYELGQKYDVEMPICEAVYDILYSGLTCKAALHRLLERDLPETE